MGRTRATEEEHVANLDIRATEAARQLARKRVELAMKHYPEICETMWQKVLSLGHTAISIKTAGMHMAKVFQRTGVGEKAGVARGRCQHQAGGAGGGVCSGRDTA